MCLFRTNLSKDDDDDESLPFFMRAAPSALTWGDIFLLKVYPKAVRREREAHQSGIKPKILLQPKLATTTPLSDVICFRKFRKRPPNIPSKREERENLNIFDRPYSLFPEQFCKSSICQAVSYAMCTL